MPYGSLLSDVVQSSTANTPPQFNDGNGTQIGTLCRAWVQFNGSTAVKNASFNISSVTRNATGDYTLSFTNAMPDTNYSVVGTSGQLAGQIITSPWTSKATPTTSTFYAACLSYAGSYADATTISIAVFR